MKNGEIRYLRRECRAGLIVLTMRAGELKRVIAGTCIGIVNIPANVAERVEVEFGGIAGITRVW